ncbi:hypothetical protein ACWFQ8_21055 [Streptomyces sp. NPDC055254]
MRGGCLDENSYRASASLLKHHLEPALGSVNPAEISPPLVRSRRADKLAAGTGPTTVAKAYALLRAILGTARSDELIRRNPCQVKGASSVHTPERPTATVKEVYALAEAIQPRYRALVLMAGFLGLRWGGTPVRIRDRLIADALSGLVKKGRKSRKKEAQGTKEDPQRKRRAGGTES